MIFLRKSVIHFKMKLFSSYETADCITFSIAVSIRSLIISISDSNRSSTSVSRVDSLAMLLAKMVVTQF